MNLLLSKYLRHTGWCFFLITNGLFFAMPLVAQKNDKKTLENKRKKLNEEITQINQHLDETKTNKKLSLNQLLILNKKITVREELIKSIGGELTTIGYQINQNNAKVNQLKKDLEQLKADYAKMVLAAYKNKSSYNHLMFLFSSTDFSQAYMRLKYMQQINEQRRKQAESILKTQGDIKLTIDELQGKKVEQSQLLHTEKKEKESLTVEKTEKEQNVASLQEKEQTLKEQLERKKLETAKLQAAIQELIKAEIARKQKEAADKALAKAKRKEQLEAAKKKLAESKKKSEKSKSSEKEDKKPVAAGKENNKEENKPVTKTKEEDDFPEKEDNTAPSIGGDFASNKGNLPWPVSKGVIVEGFGEHEHPLIKGFTTFNNGIDISTSKGAQVRAIHAGEVTSVANFSSLGKLVIIRHGEYLSVYVHLGEVFVSQGQKVSAKQVIGSVLYDETENKNIVQLQVWKGQTKLNPAAWIGN
jgi:murein hydrolase activator